MTGKKGYPRKPYSFERVLKDLADDIGYENIETVIEKKRKAIEHISNPNFKDRQLHIQDGLELDIHCKKIGKGTPFLTAYETLLKKEIDSIEMIRMIATARILMPKSKIRLSAGREKLTKESQILCFQCGANSIFYGDELLTTSNPSFQDDRKLLKDVGVLFNIDFEYCDKTVSTV